MLDRLLALHLTGCAATIETWFGAEPNTGPDMGHGQHIRPSMLTRRDNDATLSCTPKYTNP